VLAGLLAGIIVAVAEAALYIIYTTPQKTLTRTIRSRIPAAIGKVKEDPPTTGEDAAPDMSSVENVDTKGLRRRTKAG
jgi:hypothetical protein